MKLVVVHKITIFRPKITKYCPENQIY